MARDTFYAKRGDRNPPLRATLIGADKAVANLTGITSVYFHMKDTSTGVVKVNAAASVVDAVTGSVKYEWGATDLDTAGTYFGEFEVIDGNGFPTSFPNNDYFIVQVAEDIV